MNKVLENFKSYLDSNVEKIGEAQKLLRILQVGATTVSAIAPEVSPILPALEIASDLIDLNKRSFQMGSWLTGRLNPAIKEETYADALGNAKMTRIYPKSEFVKSESIANDLEKVQMWLISLKKAERQGLIQFLAEHFLDTFPSETPKQKLLSQAAKLQLERKKAREAQKQAASKAYYWRQRRRKKQRPNVSFSKGRKRN